MQDNDAAPTYQIWGPDQTAYGPVELPTLVSWIKDERVVADTWVFADETNTWSKAAQIPELTMFFRPKAKEPQDSEEGAQQSDQPNIELKPGSLRRIKIFASLSDAELSSFLKFLEIVSVPPFKQIVKKGDPGDAMYLILEGELRSCILVEGRESPVATLTPGSIFGEVSFLDRGPHAADISQIPSAFSSG
jgi:hypothetical protein